MAVKAEVVPDLLRGLCAKAGRVRMACIKDLERLSRNSPEILYPWFDRFVELLDSENSILRWNATRILANLAPVDKEAKLDAILEKFLAPIRGSQMIAAAVTLQSAPTLVRAKPYLAERVALAMLGVARARYQTEECRNVALGHAIEAFGRMFDLVPDQGRVQRLVRTQRNNTRAGTRKRAEEFLVKYSQAGARRKDTRRRVPRET